MKFHTYIFAALLALCALPVALSLSRPSISVDAPRVVDTIATSGKPIIEYSADRPVSRPLKSTNTIDATQEKTSLTTSEKSADAELKILSDSYPIYLTGKISVFDAMLELKKERKITFVYREYPGMGAQIDSINGSAPKGFYWILYVNGTQSQLGASSVIISPGDVIEWRLDKSY